MQKFYIKEKLQSNNQLSSALAVYKEMQKLAFADQESLWVIYVNAKNKILGKDMVSLGGVESAAVDMKILFRRVFLKNASSFLIVHNHPSGELTPSRQDIKLTENIKSASEILQVRFLDHIIIGENGYYSFQSDNIL